MHPIRTRFKTDIVAEVIPSAKPSNKVIIFCDGMPSVPHKTAVMRFVSNKGFWAVHPRYRGSWESGGMLFEHDPTQDILDVIDGLYKPFIDVFNKTDVCIPHPEIYIIGSSFGGPAALFAARDPRVKKVITISSVVDWTAKSPDEPLEKLIDFVREGFGNGYRIYQDGWNKILSGHFYNPVTNTDFPSEKILMIHAEDDEVVLYKPVKQFAVQKGMQLLSLKKGGHLSSKIIQKWSLWWNIKRFLNS